MHKFLFSLLLLKITFSAFAIGKTAILNSENDTLNKLYFDSLSYVTYTSPGGGFASGNNAYLDKAKVQEFHAGNPCNIYAVIFQFGSKVFSSLSDSSYIGVNFYLLNNTGKSTLSSTATCPGSIFYRDSIKVADIDTVNGNVLNYFNPLFTDSLFGIGIDFNRLHAADTVALYTNNDGDAGVREQSWEQDASGNWFTLKYNWPLNVDYAIFPVVNTSVGLNVLNTKNQDIQLSPNPSLNGSTLVNIAKSEIVNLQVYNSNLQVVSSNFTSVDDKNSRIEFESISKGVYFIQIRTHVSVNMLKLIVN